MMLVGAVFVFGQQEQCDICRFARRAYAQQLCNCLDQILWCPANFRMTAVDLICHHYALSVYLNVYLAVRTGGE